MNFLELLFDSIKDSLNDTWTAFPVLLVLYFILEWYGHSRGYGFFDKLNYKSYYGPVIGAFLGLIPQCGLGVLLTGLYLRGMITTGTLLAVYIATSDEALIVMLAHLENTQYILLIMAIKLVFGSLIGIIIDKVFQLQKPELKDKFLDQKIKHTINIEPVHSAGRHNWSHLHLKTLVWHAFKHSVNIYLYILVFSIFLFMSFQFIDIDSIPETLSKYGSIEIIGTTLIGLIPNCIASVAIAQAFLYSSLSFGAVIAGLSSAAGIGLIVLLKEAKIKTSFRIIMILVVYSSLLGFLVNSLYPLRLPPAKVQIHEHFHQHNE